MSPKELAAVCFKPKSKTKRNRWALKRSRRRDSSVRGLVNRRRGGIEWDGRGLLAMKLFTAVTCILLTRCVV